MAGPYSERTPFDDPFGYERGPEPDTGKSVFATYLEGQLELGSVERADRFEILRRALGKDAQIPEGADVMEREPLVSFLEAVLGTPEEVDRVLCAMTHAELVEKFGENTDLLVTVAAYADLASHEGVSRAT